ncbi:MAG: uroporphyrinogen-III decarboxylase-like protein, partial [Fibrobacteres bacterium]|nr:uroporphyrinogen-III decarboxylase-like protein [Fibrobacterota bacterium]
MKKESMSPKERWLAVLQRKTPDRIPMDYWGTSEITAKVLKHLGVSSRQEMDAKLHIDSPLTVTPKYNGPALAEGENIWGVITKTVDYGSGTYDECSNHPLADFETVDDIKKNYKFPTADLFDYTVIKSQIKGNEHRPIRGGGSEPFLMYKYLRGDEQAFMDLIINPEIVHYCMEQMYSFCYENTRRIYEAIPGQVLISYVAEDMGSQESL